MKGIFFKCGLIATFLFQCSIDVIFAQRGGGGRGGGGRELMLVERFDADGNGILQTDERQKAREFAKKERIQSRRRLGQNQPRNETGRYVTLDEVSTFEGNELYDPFIVRTLFLEFSTKDWESEMMDFYRSDVLLPARLTVDDVSYPNIGVSFRGNSSYFTVSSGQKRSLNLVIDHMDPKQNLMGYRTINLLNAHADPSFLREVIYNMVARNYIPAPLANFVRLIINGEDWGIYVNAQQLNKEFTQKWFGSRSGVRWKIRAGGGLRSMNYNGEDPKSYKAFYEIKSKDSSQAWENLIRVCRELNTLRVDEFDHELDQVLNVDRALWFLALDNVLIDADGYYARGSDYMLYEEPDYDRFHLLPYDSNETFRYPGGGGPGRGSRINVKGVALNPFEGEKNEALPLLNRLMKNPQIRSRYLAHVRTIVDEWFENDRLKEMMQKCHKLISDFVEIDEKKLYTTEAFHSNLHKDEKGGRRDVPGLLSFVRQRRDYFRDFEAFQIQAPKIMNVAREDYEKAAFAGEPVSILVRLEEPFSETRVWVYFANDRNQKFESIEAKALSDDIYHAEIPAMKAGDRVFYYAEARHFGDRMVSRFSPRNTILGAPSFEIIPKQTSDSPLLINEVMPSNSRFAKDPQGEFDDWIEIFNPSDKVIDLSGMFMSDRISNLRRWQFPSGTMISPSSFLLIWADGETEKKGLHAGFKLAEKGETIFLIDSDLRGNAIIDQLTYDRVNEDESFGRLPSGKLAVMPPTPGTKNR